MRNWITTLILISLPLYIFGQCQRPTLKSFIQTSTESVQFDLEDYNSGAVQWEVYLAEGTQGFSSAVSKGIFTSKVISIGNLSAGKAYRIWLVAICSSGNRSQNNGPYLFHTAIDNQNSCNLGLTLSDNNCENEADVFDILVTNPGNLGTQIFVESVDLILKHEFPADLHISLKSPSGIVIPLSSHHGIQNDNYGIADSTCSQFTRFSSAACLEIGDAVPPFLGDHKPEESLSKFHNNSAAAGMWKLIICDNAETDVGRLEYVRINFSNAQCTPIEDYGIHSISDKTASIRWKAPSLCGDIKIEFGLSGFIPGQGTTVFLNCANEARVLSGLLPNTSYDVYLSSVCGPVSTPSSCPIQFSTRCQVPQIQLDFDDEELCVSSCSTPCSISGWSNDIENDDTDWIVWSGPTNTENTGPDDDVSQGGKYLYVENNPGLCGAFTSATLKSPCMQVSGLSASCGMNLSYHMLGNDIGTLRVLVVTNDGETVDTVWSRSGSQGGEWLRAEIDLSPFEQLLFTIEIQAVTGNGINGDIAIDQIEIFGLTLTSGQAIYYRDMDLDNFGDENDFILTCSSVIPEGYTNVPGDCDDTNSTVYPGATEILCNLIDENCNGMADDRQGDDLLVVSGLVVKDVSCLGRSDGGLDITVTGGVEPFTFEWSNGQTTEDLDQVEAGNYRVIVRDAGGCSYQTNMLTVGVTLQGEAPQILKTDPTCEGIEDGKVSIVNPQPNATYMWSNGQSGLNLEGLSSGKFATTAILQDGCIIESDTIMLTAKKTLDILESNRRIVSCFGGNNGRIEILGSGGQAPYTIQWDGGFVGGLRNDLGAGLYTGVVIDQLGCRGSWEVSIEEPDSFFTEVLSIEHVSCFGKENGIVRTMTNGGNAPYTYYWSNGSISPILTNIPASTYTLTVSDNKGCSTNLSNVVIKQPSELSSTIVGIQPSSCFLRSDGFISVNTTGGIEPYTHIWRNQISNDTFLNNIQSGVYNLTILDGNNCKASIPNITVPTGNEPSPIRTQIDSVNICAGQEIAKISATVEQGIGPFDYNWNHGVQYILNESSTSVSNLAIGNYIVTVTDGEGCISTSDPVVLAPLQPLVFSLNALTQTECRDDSTGFIDVNISGGKQPYTYMWSNGQMTSSVSNLTYGFYTLEVTDSIGCSVTSQPYLIDSKSKLTTLIQKLNSSSDMATGSITVTPFNGVPPYTISWTDPQYEGFSLAGLHVGSYGFQVEDSLGCTIDSTILIGISTVYIHEKSELENIRVYPNPTTSILQIDFENIQNTEFNITLFSVAGEIISRYSSIQGDKKLDIDLSSFKSGIYIIQIASDNKTIYKKIIKIDP